ncbi:hypothetical protein D3C71_1174320 [compost metagenome]
MRNRVAGVVPQLGFWLISLATVPGHAQAPPQVSDQPQYGVRVRCESVNGVTRQCEIPGRAQLIRLLSTTGCFEGKNWGQSGKTLWVSEGCRGEFLIRSANVSYGAAGTTSERGHLITCASIKKRDARCDVTIEHYARLSRQLSAVDCLETITWGWDREGVWVADGCRGQFEVN